jgi:hypothetical protein
MTLSLSLSNQIIYIIYLNILELSSENKITFLNFIYITFFISCNKKIYVIKFFILSIHFKKNYIN